MTHPNERFVAAPLVDRTNGEPAILRGLTSTESTWAIGLAFVVWLLPGAGLGFLIATVAWPALAIAVTVLVCTILPVATVWFGAGALAKLKRERPAHYHIHLARLYLTRYLGRRQHFIAHRGPWDLGRSLPRK